MVKYLICKPREGFIDIISLITLALKYCVKYDRILVIDTRKSLHFKDTFNKYFYINNNNTYKKKINVLYSTLKEKSIYPNNIEIDYFNFDPHLDSLFMSIKLDKNYKDDVLMFGHKNHMVNFKARDIIYFLQNFSFKPIILDCFKKRYNLLPKDYISLHIRNTDRRSDISSFINEHDKLIDNKHIFLATDDSNVIDIFKKKYNNIYTFAKICENKTSGGIHFVVRNEVEHTNFNIDTVVDFLLLSSAKNYYYSCSKSGFSICADILFKEKKTINSLLGICSNDSK